MTDDKKDNHDEQHNDDTHEYDGIKELNNPAPYWVLILFFVSIMFAGMYAIKYFGYPDNGMDQESEYKTAVAAHQMQSKTGGSTNALSEVEMIAEGKKLFNEKGCIACHGANGEGNAVGPNLCDKAWIHGCTFENIHTIISEGKPEKGMTPFKSMLSGNQIDQITTFILKSLHGTTPANAKAAQGTACN